MPYDSAPGFTNCLSFRLRSIKRAEPPSDEGGGCQRQTEGEKKPPLEARGAAPIGAEGIYCTTILRRDLRTTYLFVCAHAALSLPLEWLAPAGAVSSATAMGGS